MRIILAAIAALQAAFTAAAWMTPAAGPIFGLPARAIQAASTVVALGLAGPAIAVWRAPQGTVARGLSGALTRLRRHPASLILPLALLIPPIVYLPGRWIGYPLVSVELILLALLLYLAAPPERRDRPGPFVAIVSVAVIVVGLALRAWLVWHSAFDDEGMTLSAAANIARGGGLAPGMMRLPASAPDRPDWGRLLIVYGWWVRAFGVGLVQIRLLGWALGALALGAIYGGIRALYDRQSALIGTALAAASVLGLYSAVGRNNGLPMLAAALVLWLHLWLHKRGPDAAHLLVGIAAALSLEAHLLNLALVTALGGAYLVDYLREVRDGERILHRSPLWFYLIGALPLLAGYVYLHILSLPNPAGYLSYLGGFGMEGGLAASLTARLAAAGLRYRLWWDASPAGVLLIATAVAAAIVRHEEPDRHWLALLAFGELGYFLFNPTNVVNNDYTAFALAVIFLGAGPLIARGFRPGDAPPVWQRPAAALSLMLLLTYSGHTVRDRQVTAERFDAIRQPLVAELRERVPAGQTVMALEFMYPDLTDYDVLLTPGAHHDSTLAPALAGVDHDAYWLDVLLEAWPQAEIDSHFYPPRERLKADTLAGSYLLALDAHHPADYLWVLPADKWTRPPGAAEGDAALVMTAVSAMPGAAAPGGTITLRTVWAVRAPLDADARLTLTLVAADGSALPAGDVTLLSADGAPTTGWAPYRFVAADLPLTLPAGTLPGAYTLRAEIDPSTVCAPRCAIDLGRIDVAP